MVTPNGECGIDVLIWAQQRCLFHREVDGLADRPVVEQPAPLPAWRVRALLQSCTDQAGLPAQLRMALAEAGLHLPPGPDQTVALIDQAAERVASGALRMVIRPPARLVISFDPLWPQGHRMDATLRLPVADGAARKASALRLLAGSPGAAQRDAAVAAALAHPAGSLWRRDVPRPAGASDLDYAAEMLARRLLLLLPQGPRGDTFRLAWTLADSQPSAPLLPDAPPPPPPAKPKPKEEVGELSVHVTRPDGKPIEGVDVNVEGLGLEKTDKDGFARYGKVACRGYDASGKKKGFSDTEGGEFKAAEGSGTVVEEEHTIIELVLYPYKIISIAGSVRGTPGVRNPNNKSPRDHLKKSTTDEKSLAINEPAVVVRGCHRIRLVAVTSPPEQPVEWSVEANENSEAAPSIKADKNAWEAILQTGKTGSFSVIGTCGDNKIVWNIVFVWVKVNVAGGMVRKASRFYKDAGSSVDLIPGAGGDVAIESTVNFESGNFDGRRTGHYAWQASVPVELVGGGDSKTLGIDQIDIRYLQNGVADTLMAHYLYGSTALEVPKGGLPIVDSNDESQPDVFMDCSIEVTPNQTARKRDIWMADSPAGSFPNLRRTRDNTMTSTTGINGFQASVTSTSKQAPNSYVVHAKIGWAAHYEGVVIQSLAEFIANQVPEWKPAGAMTSGDMQFSLVSPGTGGQDAAEAKFETFEPRFNGGTNTRWAGP